MSDLISRQAAIEALGDMPMSWADTDAEIQAQEDWKQHREALLNLPTADLSEYSDKLWETAYERGKAEAHPKKGEWVAFANEGGELDLRCSVCGEEQGFFFGYFNYCPYCGARMEDEHMANLREYAHDFGVTIEQAEEALRREE